MKEAEALLRTPMTVNRPLNIRREPQKSIGGSCQSSLTWVAHPLLKRLLEPPDVQGLRRHPHQGHYLQELLLSSVTELLDIVSTWMKENF
jgi:hypothetical protein